MSIERNHTQSHSCTGAETRFWQPFDTAKAPPPSAIQRNEGGSGRLIAGRYRLHRVLGRGGMGTVWLAGDETLARPVAIKEFTLPEDVIARAEAEAWVLSEARAAAQLSHPGVVSVYDVAVEDSQLWIVMEPLSGQTLADAIREHGRLDPGTVLQIAVQLLEALRAVHDEGIVHRDVKPSNVQLSADGRVVLTDFGLAARDGAAPPITPGQVVGSPPYMAPESIQEGRFGPASDLFALGATLYAATEGHQPFDERSMWSTLEAVKYEDPHPARHAGCLRPVIDGLLTKDPDARLSLSQAYQYLLASKSELVGSFAPAPSAPFKIQASGNAAVPVGLRS